MLIGSHSLHRHRPPPPPSVHTASVEAIRFVRLSAQYAISYRPLPPFGVTTSTRACVSPPSFRKISVIALKLNQCSNVWRTNALVRVWHIIQLCFGKKTCVCVRALLLSYVHTYVELISGVETDLPTFIMVRSWGMLRRACALMFVYCTAPGEDA